MDCLMNPVQIICMEVESCVNEWGTGLCRAPYLPTQGDIKPCFNTLSTCKNKFARYSDNGVITRNNCGGDGVQIEGYKCGFKKLYFSTCEISMTLQLQLEQDGVYVGPTIKDIDRKTGVLSAQKSLSTRSTATIRISDQDHNDIGIDPYFKDRSYFKINSVNKPSGTFWSRFLARNKNVENTNLKVFCGDCAYDSLDQFDTSEYIISSIDGVDSSHCVSIKALDPMDLADGKDDKCPEPFTDIDSQEWNLTRPLTDNYVGRLPASRVNWYGDSNYFLEYHYSQKQTQYVCIGDEIMEGQLLPLAIGGNSSKGESFCFPSYANQALEVSFTITKRGALGTEVEEHDVGAVITMALCIPKSTTIACAILNILEMCSDVRNQKGACCTEDYARLIEYPTDINCNALSRLYCDVVICKPVSVRKLLDELAEQFGFRIYYNDKTQKIEWFKYQPPCTIKHIDENEYEDKTFTVKRRNAKRYNQVTIFYGVKDVSKGIDDGNFNKSYTQVNLDAVDCGVTNVKKIYSRWHCDASLFLMRCESQRYLDQNACDVFDLEFVVPKTSDLCVTDYFTIDNCKITDVCGDESGIVWQVIQQIPKSDCTVIRAEQTAFVSDQCWLTKLCGELSDGCGQVIDSNISDPVLIEGDQYYCECSVY